MSILTLTAGLGPANHAAASPAPGSLPETSATCLPVPPLIPAVPAPLRVGPQGACASQAATPSSAPQSAASSGGASDQTTSTTGVGPWVHLPQSMPPSRYNLQMTDDTRRGRVVVFGGCCPPGQQESADTWEFDGASWSEMHPTGVPQFREAGNLAFDAATGTSVLFGGMTCPVPPGQTAGSVLCHLLNDTWTWDGVAWTEQHPAHQPPPRLFAGMAYHAATGRVVLFGGLTCTTSSCSALASLADTWTWDGVDWTEQSPPTSPPPTVAPAFSSDEAHAQVVMFGGATCSSSCTMLTGTWTWDGANWSLRSPSASPPARLSSAMTDDLGSQRVVLFGGEDSNGVFLADTWAWDGATWTQVQGTSSPPGRLGAGLVYAPSLHEDVLFGGLSGLYTSDLLDDTWFLSASGWTMLARTWPQNRWGAVMAYDSDRQQTVLFGGSDSGPEYNDTWVWDGNSWSEMHPQHSPPPRFWANMAYDSVRKQIVLFGGVTCTPACYTPLTDTWTWDGADWTQKVTVLSPQPSLDDSGQMAYDAARGDVVYLDSLPVTDGQTSGQTWIWDGTSWLLRPVVSPPARQSGAMAYDAAHQQIVLFGGYGFNSGMLNDTWTWDGTAWSQQHPAHSPLPRWFGSLAFNPSSNTVVLFGGGDLSGRSCDCDTWNWDGSDWTLRDPGSANGLIPSQPGRPSPRGEAVMAPDVTGHLLLFGGDAGGRGINEAWRYEPQSPPPNVPETPWGPLLVILGAAAVATRRLSGPRRLHRVFRAAR